MKAGEDNPQAREEEGKLPSLRTEFLECGDWNSVGKPLLSAGEDMGCGTGSV